MPSQTISGERRRKEQFGEKNSITSLLSSNICMYVCICYSYVWHVLQKILLFKETFFVSAKICQLYKRGIVSIYFSSSTMFTGYSIYDAAKVSKVSWGEGPCHKGRIQDFSQWTYPTPPPLSSFGPSGERASGLRWGAYQKGRIQDFSQRTNPTPPSPLILKMHLALSNISLPDLKKAFGTIQYIPSWS